MKRTNVQNSPATSFPDGFPACWFRDLSGILSERLSYLDRIITTREKAIKKAPPGHLRVSRRGSRNVYYHRTDAKDTNGKYIPKNKRDLARRLAQKSYDQKLLLTAQQEAASIERFLADYPDVLTEEVYDTVSECRRELVIPAAETDGLFMERWAAAGTGSGAGIPFSSALYTDLGEHVRSKSEVLIANQLARNNIPYHYEQPLYLDGFSTVYPDFTVLNTRTRKTYYWEHNGMIDDIQYAERAVRKLTAYEMSGHHPGIDLILTFETTEQPLNLKLVSLIIETYLL